MDWTWRVESVRDGAVVHSEQRTVTTLPRCRTPWGPAFGHTEANAFDLLKLPAAPVGAREYQRAVLIGRT